MRRHPSVGEGAAQTCRERGPLRISINAGANSNEAMRFVKQANCRWIFRAPLRSDQLRTHRKMDWTNLRWYLRDWSGVSDVGARSETLVACHLLKAVEGWTDIGLGKFELHYLRDKLKREVDFLVSRNGKPWFLVEVKQADRSLSSSLAHFQSETKAAHAFQVVIDLPFEAADCFAHLQPLVVPAKTFLSQLI